MENVTQPNDAGPMAGIPSLRSGTSELMSAMYDALDNYRRADVTERDRVGKWLVDKKMGAAVH